MLDKLEVMDGYHGKRSTKEPIWFPLGSKSHSRSLRDAVTTISEVPHYSRPKLSL